MAQNIVDEIFFKIGFDIKDEKVKSLRDNIKGIISTVTKFVGAVALVTTALDRMSNSLAKNNQQFINFNRQTGLSIAQMQKLATVAGLVDYNFSPETAMQGLQALESNLAQIRLGEGNIAPFQILGISPVGKDAFQIIEDLREAIKGIDDMTAVNLIQQMGLSPEFISLLRMTREEVEALNDESLMLSPEERQAMQQFSMELKKVHMQLLVLKDRAIIPLIPALTKFLNGLAAIFEMFVKIEKALINIWNWFGKFKGAIATLALGIVAYFNPVIAIVTALYLLLEDIAVWMTGGKSFLGTTFDKMTEFFDNFKLPKGMTEFFDKIGEGLDFTGKVLYNMQPAYQPALSLATSGGSTGGTITTTNTINQNNTFYTNDVIPEQMAQKTADLAFAYAQVDRTV